MSKPTRYLLDTNVLLYDSDALLAYPDEEVIVPITVIEEIDQFKSEVTETGRNARLVSKTIDTYRRTGSLAAGVLWATLLFAAILGINRLFVAEREEGGFDAIRLAPIDRTAFFAAKAAALLVYLVALELVVVPVFAVFFLDSAAALPPLLLVLLLACLGIAATWTLISAIAVHSRARDLMMICCNPDRIVVTAFGVIPATGSVAALYEELGGRVHYVGKPHPLVYRICLGALQPIPKERILAVGDSLEHDIAGGTAEQQVLEGVVGDDAAAVPVDPWQLAYVMYTSGSAGAPKGVSISHRNVLDLADDGAWDTGGSMRMLFHSPFAFDASTLESWIPLLTGGTVVDPKETGPGQIRGAMIAGGVEHRLAKGDVFVVPNNEPHWFKEVQAPFLYFVVKPIAPKGDVS